MVRTPIAEVDCFAEELAVHARDQIGQICPCGRPCMPTL